jgi:hypothetical protein
VAHSGPYPVAWATLSRGTKTSGVAVEGRDQTRAPVDQPFVTKGHWISGSGDAVVEAGYADSLGIHVGDQIGLNRTHFLVVGFAVTAAVPDYPSMQIAVGASPFPDPGLIWVGRAAARKLASAPLPLSYLLNLKLSRSLPHLPQGVQGVDLGGGRLWHMGCPCSIISADEILLRDAKPIAVERRALTIGSWLLGLLAVASIAVLVGGRMAEQERRVGLLKAVGATPALIAAVLLVEHLALALGAAAAGLLIGWLAAPLLTNPGAGLLGSSGAPSLTASMVELVTAVALAVAILATLVPALRASRLSTVRALANAARSPRRRPRLIGLSTHLPVPLLLGLRLAARRPRRAALAAFSIAITVTTIVAVVTVHAHQASGQAPTGFSAIDNPRHDHINHALLLVSVVLVVLAAINAIFITWSTAIDARHQLTIARALGATPAQISAGLTAAQLIPALPGAILGIPTGIALVTVLSNGDTVTIPSAQSLVAVLLGTLLTTATLSTIAAWIGARQPVAGILEAELA